MKRNKRGFSLIELMVVVAITGILSSIALPQFMLFRARARQAEAKGNLRSWYMAETIYYSEKSTYTELIVDSAYSPSVGNLYSYQFSQSCTYEVRNSSGASTPDNANCISVDLNRFPTSALAYAPAGSVTFVGPGTDPALPGFAGSCPNCNIAGVATANLDNELAGIDTWVISTKGGTSTPCGSTETLVQPGVAFQTKNDMFCD